MFDIIRNIVGRALGWNQEKERAPVHIWLAQYNDANETRMTISNGTMSTTFMISASERQKLTHDLIKIGIDLHCDVLSDD